MARTPRQAQGVSAQLDADAMIVEMDLEREYRANLLKELSQSYQRDLDRASEAVMAHDTLYHWWWKFIQAHYLHPSADRDPYGDATLAATLDKFGNPNLDFRDWWIQTGRDLFQEQGDLPLIKVVELDRDFGPDEFPKSITLEIPLTIPRDGIVHQLDRILAVCHSGAKLKRHAASTAEVKIHPKPRYRVDKMSNLLKIWLKVQSEIQWLDRPENDWWKIARYMELKSDWDYDDYEGAASDLKRELGRTARRMYDQADSIMAHAVRGQFPHD